MTGTLVASGIEPAASTRLASLVLVTENVSYEAVPAAGPLVEALRGVGYTLEAAIADLVDNSISAGASQVLVTFGWEEAESYIAIADNGSGMDQQGLVEAMRLGSRDPRQVRAPHDLGRFGLGLKTASFSQCRSLTVASRVRGASLAALRWDLDHITDTGRWSLLEPHPRSPSRLASLDEFQSGTVVLLERLDSLVPRGVVEGDGARQRFLDMALAVKRHLAMIFHRYLDGARPRLVMHVNGRGDANRVRPWDPFLLEHPATTRTPPEKLGTACGTVSVQGFVLPHRDQLQPREFDSAAGPAGWAAHQGFFVYRNERLLLAGSWLGLGSPRAWTQEEGFRLARLRLDLPNTCDMAWKIDVKKSVARPPHDVRVRLTDLAEHVRGRARRVLAYRSPLPSREVQQSLRRAWVVSGGAAAPAYRIDREHPAVSALLNSEPGSCSGVPSVAEAALRVIENTMPVERIWLDAPPADRRGDTTEGQDADAMRPVLLAVYRHLVLVVGLAPAAAREQLRRTEPFHTQPALIDQLPDEPGERRDA